MMGVNCLRILLAQVSKALTSGNISGKWVEDGDVSRGTGDLLLFLQIFNIYGCLTGFIE
jgi:hypothetical protein